MKEVEIKARLREAGWTVAVHNDYRLHGKPHVFWLWTHPSGVWAKGEGETDEAALLQAEDQVRERTPKPPPRCGSRSGRMRCEFTKGHEGDHRCGPAGWCNVPLVDALVSAAVSENDRAVHQALEAERTGESTAAPGQMWDTMFRATFERVLKDYA